MIIFSFMSVGWGQDNDINKFSLIDTSLLKYKSLDLHTLLIDGIDYEKFEKLLIQQERNNYQSTLTYSENFNWVDENWFEQRRTTCTLNEDFYIIEKNIEEFVDGFWVNDKKEIYNYDNSYDTIELISQLWNGNIYINDYRILTIYDQNNNILERHEQYWELSEWVSNYESFNIYDFNNNLIESKEYVEFNGQEFEYITKDTYLYDFNNNQIEFINQISYDDYYWENNHKTSKTYDDDNNLIEINNQWWSEYELEWINDSKSILIYDDDKCIEKLELRWIDEEWINNNLYEMTYNTFNQKSLEEVYFWNDFEWEISYVEQWTFHPFNQNIETYSQFIQHQEGNNNGWFRTLQCQFEYDQYDYLSQTTINFFFIEEWDIDDYGVRYIHINDQLNNDLIFISQRSVDHINWTNSYMTNFNYFYHCNNNEVVLWDGCYNINLSSLSLFNHNLPGEIPPEIGNLTNLTYLNLSNNQFTGEIPPEIGNLINLTTLDLSDNEFNGEIPFSIGNLTNLTSLKLDDNQLTGEIPSSIGNLIELDFLYLNNNQLTGEIPNDLWNLNSYPYLTIYNNNFTFSLEIEENLNSNSFRYLNLQNGLDVIELELKLGNNLISFPYISHNTYRDGIVFRFENIIDKIIGEGVSTINNDGNWLGSLGTIEITSGYWVHCTDTLQSISILSFDNSNVEYNLNSGNNLISYPCLESLPITDILPDDIELSVNQIIGEGVSTVQISPYNWVGSLSELQPNKGYWMKLTDDIDFIFECD